MSSESADTSNATAASENDRGGHHEPEQDRFHWSTEIIATVLLAMATVTAAWCAFESAKWSGVQANSFSAAGATRTESVRSSTEAGQLQTIDITLFTQWLAAKADDQDKLAEFYEDRFRPEFQPAFEEWVESDPLKNKDAAKSPFDLDSYTLAAEQKATELQTEADELAKTAREANSRSDSYVLATVMFAMVMFFAGVSTKLVGKFSRLGVLAVGTLVFLVSIGAVATLPIEF